jgi:hypothetical protein
MDDEDDYDYDYLQEQLEEAYDEGYNDGVAEGIQEEKSRWHSILQRNFEYAMNSNKLKEALFYKNVIEVLSIQIDMQKASEQHDRDMESF